MEPRKTFDKFLTYNKPCQVTLKYSTPKGWPDEPMPSKYSPDGQWLFTVIVHGTDEEYGWFLDTNDPNVQTLIQIGKDELFAVTKHDPTELDPTPTSKRPALVIDWNERVQDDPPPHAPSSTPPSPPAPPPPTQEHAPTNGKPPKPTLHFSNLVQTLCACLVATRSILREVCEMPELVPNEEMWHTLTNTLFIACQKEGLYLTKEQAKAAIEHYAKTLNL